MASRKEDLAVLRRRFEWADGYLQAGEQYYSRLKNTLLIQVDDADFTADRMAVLLRDLCREMFANLHVPSLIEEELRDKAAEIYGAEDERAHHLSCILQAGQQLGARLPAAQSVDEWIPFAAHILNFLQASLEPARAYRDELRLRLEELSLFGAQQNRAAKRKKRAERIVKLRELHPDASYAELARIAAADSEIVATGEKVTKNIVREALAKKSRKKSTSRVPGKK